jgi:hypothetical protein
MVKDEIAEGVSRFFKEKEYWRIGECLKYEVIGFFNPETQKMRKMADVKDVFGGGLSIDRWCKYCRCRPNIHYNSGEIYEIEPDFGLVVMGGPNAWLDEPSYVTTFFRMNPKEPRYKTKQEKKIQEMKDGISSLEDEVAGKQGELEELISSYQRLDSKSVVKKLRALESCVKKEIEDLLIKKGEIQNKVEITPIVPGDWRNVYPKGLTWAEGKLHKEFIRWSMRDPKAVDIYCLSPRRWEEADPGHGVPARYASYPLYDSTEGIFMSTTGDFSDVVRIVDEDVYERLDGKPGKGDTVDKLIGFSDAVILIKKRFGLG